MFIKRNDEEGTTPTGHEDSAELKKMLTSCMINRQILVRPPALLSGRALDWISAQQQSRAPQYTASAIKALLNQKRYCCVAGVLIGIPISIQRKSYKPFAILGVLGSFVDYSVPYTNDCRLIHNAMQLALQQERQRDAAAKTLSFGDDAKE